MYVYLYFIFLFLLLIFNYYLVWPIFQFFLQAQIKAQFHLFAVSLVSILQAHNSSHNRPNQSRPNRMAPGPAAYLHACSLGALQLPRAHSFPSRCQQLQERPAASNVAPVKSGAPTPAYKPTGMLSLSMNTQTSCSPMLQLTATSSHAFSPSPCSRPLDKQPGQSGPWPEAPYPRLQASHDHSNLLQTAPPASNHAQVCSEPTARHGHPRRQLACAKEFLFAHVCEA